MQEIKRVAFRGFYAHWALSALGALGACEPGAVDGRKVVVVTPVLEPALLAQVGSLAAVPLLNGVLPGGGAEVFQQDMRPFTLILPATASGRFTVDVEAAAPGHRTDPHGAALASGRGEVTIGEATDYALEVRLAAEPCVLQRWCWTDPMGSFTDLHGVWGSAARDLFVVGDHGLVLHRSAFSWTQQESGVSEGLYAVWGSGPQDVWATGDNGTIIHFDGKGWSHSQSGTTMDILALWGSGPQDVWAAGSLGESGGILRYQGGAWTPVKDSDVEASPPLRSLWGSGPRDVWAVGDFGAALRWDGSSWKRQATPMTARLSGVWGSGPSDVWAVGEAATLLRNRGSGWKALSIGTRALHAVSGSGPDEVWLADSQGTFWRKLSNDDFLGVSSGLEFSPYALFVRGPQEAYCAGNSGTLLRWNGNAWGSALPGSAR